MPRPTAPAADPAADPAARVRALADEQGVTVGELAAAAGVTRQAISRWLHGRGGVTLATVQAVLKALGARWGDLDDPAA